MYKKVELKDGFVGMENDVAKLWKEKDIVKKNFAMNEGKRYFTFYDGPPTANGKPHVGHIETRVYWESQKEKDEYKEFWKQYQEIKKMKETDFIEYVKQKEILFIRNDIKKLNNGKTDFSKLMKYYKRKLVDYGVMRQIQNSCISQGKYTKIKQVA